MGGFVIHPTFCFQEGSFEDVHGNGHTTAFAG